MSDVLVYTFYNPRHLTFKILRSLNNLLIVDNDKDSGQARMTQVTEGMVIDKYYLGNLNSLAKHILNTKSKYVLGLGDYRKDSKHVRVENVFINKYGRIKIVEGGREKYCATWKLKEQGDMVYSQLGSWGPCNRSGYVLSKLIEDNRLDTKLAFIHIPSSYPAFEAMKMIINLLLEI